MSKEQKIIDYSKTIGIETIGFCNADPFLELEKELLGRREEGYIVPFEEQDIRKRVYPVETMEKAKSFIVIGESYNIIEEHNEKQDLQVLTANISVSAAGYDYHKSVMEKLEKLSVFIENAYQCKTMKFVDISPFSDRHIAKRAGLGFFGTNNMLINEKYGSRFFVGYLLTDMDFEESCKKDYIGCGSCNRCVDNCPTGAIIGNGGFNPAICISYLTQHKGDIDSELMKKMGKQLYGCDICQKVCPYNKALPNNNVIESIVPLEFPVESMLNISNKDFKRLFGNTAAGWRGKKWLQRNAIIALGNINSEQSTDLLEKHIKDKRTDIRKVIAWALKNINNRKTNELLNLMLEYEEDDELKKYIQNLKGE